MSKVKMT